MVAKKKRIGVRIKDSVWIRKKMSNYTSFLFLLEILIYLETRNGIKVTHNSSGRMCSSRNRAYFMRRGGLIY